MFNVGKEAKMISQKLAIVRVHQYEGIKVTWDRQIVEVKPPIMVEFNKLNFCISLLLRD